VGSKIVVQVVTNNAAICKIDPEYKK
jgi:hypothetical protein